MSVSVPKKVLYLPRNLHFEVQKTLCLPRNLHFQVHKMLCLLRNLYFQVHKVVSALRGLQSAVPATKSTLRGSESGVLATKSALRGSQSAAPVTKSACPNVTIHCNQPATKTALRSINRSDLLRLSRKVDFGPPKHEVSLAPATKSGHHVRKCASATRAQSREAPTAATQISRACAVEVH